MSYLPPPFEDDSNFILITGCSGGGKSTLLEELKRRGYATVLEPGRRIVQAELQSGGSALPWIDLAAFASRAVEVSLNDLEGASRSDGPVFFDRGLFDAAVAVEQVTDQPGGRNTRQRQTLFPQSLPGSSMAGAL